MSVDPETKAFANKQWKQSKGEQPEIICECGESFILRSLYRCLYCKIYLCASCAEVHFGKTVEEYYKDKEDNKC
jgi:hypothetical protein